MRAKLKPLARQIIVVTGAGGGLGLAIAEAAARAGAAVVLTGHEEAALRKAAEAINARGGRAHAVAGDLADAADAARVSRAAIARFGGFDTWINGPQAHPLATSVAAREAARHLSGHATGGAIVNLTLAASDQTRALRRELTGAPVSLTEIRLPPLSRLDAAEEMIAEAALYAAAHPLQRMTLSGGGRRLSMATAARKHRGLLVGAGLVAVAGVAAWYGRGRIGAVAAPALRRTVRPLVVRAISRSPLRALALAVRNPRATAKLAAALR